MGLLFMIVFFFGIKDSPAVQSMLKAVRPVVVGLLLWTAYDMAQTVFGVKALGWQTALAGSIDKVLLALIAFLLLTTTRVNPALLILAAALIGFSVYR